MKQFMFGCNSEETLNFTNLDILNCKLAEFKKLCEENNFSKMMFQVYSEILEEDIINNVCHIIASIFPEASYMGCSTSGNITDCKLSKAVTIACTVFEFPSTQIEIYQYDFNDEVTDSITWKILENTRSNPWVKAIELFFTIPEHSSTRFCDGLREVRQDIQIFGGVACSHDITSDASCVFSKDGGYSRNSVVVIFYGGSSFYVDSINVTGWKPLGRKFHVTKSDGCILHELDGIPAYDVYHKYLNIQNDENFFYNTLEFPLFYEHNGTTILRTPVASNADGSITMTSDIDIGSVVRISYGDPGTIIESIKEDSRKLYEFQPDIMHIFSCAARRTFWNSKEPTYEIYPFKNISPSSGFFSHGEFLRTKGNLNQHNVTLVIAGLREGGKKEMAAESIPANEKVLSKIPLVSRLATFISVTSLELEEINRKLGLANEKLKTAAIIDGMTGLYNRKEIQSQIEKKLENIHNEKFSIAMFDIDNFKQVNDTYGHQEGDAVIIALADLLNNEHASYTEKLSAGRWGGEEFMLLLSDTDVSAAALIADLIRKCFANTGFPVVRTQTVSIGVTQATQGDDIDTLCTRVDTALYKAKKTGKNKVVVI